MGGGLEATAAPSPSAATAWIEAPPASSRAEPERAAEEGRALAVLFRVYRTHHTLTLPESGIRGRIGNQSPQLPPLLILVSSKWRTEPPVERTGAGSFTLFCVGVFI